MTESKINASDDGPYIISGAFTILDGAGQEFKIDDEVYLCRCGASKNKPFCDDSHLEAGFENKPRPG